MYASENGLECTEETLSMILNSESAAVNENLILLESAGLISWQNDTILITDLIQKEIERSYRLRTVSLPGRSLRERTRKKSGSRKGSESNQRQIFFRTDAGVLV